MCLLIHICVNKYIKLFLGEKKKEILSNESCHVASSDISIPTAHSLTNLCDTAPLRLLLGQGERCSQKLNTVERSLLASKACARKGFSRTRAPRRNPASALA